MKNAHLGILTSSANEYIYEDLHWNTRLKHCHLAKSTYLKASTSPSRFANTHEIQTSFNMVVGLTAAPIYKEVIFSLMKFYHHSAKRKHMNIFTSQSCFTNTHPSLELLTSIDKENYLQTSIRPSHLASPSSNYKTTSKMHLWITDISQQRVNIWTSPLTSLALQTRAASLHSLRASQLLRPNGPSRRTHAYEIPQKPVFIQRTLTRRALITITNELRKPNHMQLPHWASLLKLSGGRRGVRRAGNVWGSFLAKTMPS